MFPESDDIPLINIWGAAPGLPEFCTTLTPDDLPCNNKPTSVLAFSLTPSKSKTEIEEVMSLLFWDPYPVKTISSKPAISGVNMILKFELASAITLCETKPINEISKVGFSWLTDNSKLPSKSVVVPLSVPDSITEAPGKGFPSESATFPDILISWELSSFKIKVVTFGFSSIIIVLFWDILYFNPVFSRHKFIRSPAEISPFFNSTFTLLLKNPFG